MAGSAISVPTFAERIGNIVNNGDGSNIYAAGAYTFKNASSVTTFAVDSAGVVTIQSNGVTDFVVNIHEKIHDNTAMTAGVGGGIWLTGNYNTAGTLRFGPAIKASKANSTTGDYGFNLDFYKAENGVAQALGGQMSATGAWTLGPANSTTASHTLYGYTKMQTGSTSGGSSGQQVAYVVKNTAAGNTNGDVYMSFHSAGNAASTNFDIRSNGTGGAFSPVSDRRLKENIKDLPTVLHLLNALRPVQFSWLGQEAIQEGFIAQELQEVFPEDVAENSEGHLQVTGWGKTEARLVKAIQELSAQVEELKAKVAALEAK